MIDIIAIKKARGEKLPPPSMTPREKGLRMLEIKKEQSLQKANEQKKKNNNHL